MAKLFPELVFVRGPQKGQRIQLSKTMNVIGRDRTCDIELLDEYASRQHARLIVEGNRVRLVNTSPNGTRVNAKPIEQAVLADGDVLGFGLECEIKFESIDSVAAKAAAAVAVPAAGGKAGEPAPAQGEQQSAKKKLKKPPAVVWVGLYLLLIAALFIFLPQILGTPEEKTDNTNPLTGEQIEKIIKEPLPPDKSDFKSGKALERAVKGVESWENNTAVGEDHLYRTYRAFKEALAYRGPGVKEFGPEDLYHPPTGEARAYKGMMEKVEKALIEKIKTTYREAYIQQRQRHWADSAELYRKVLAMIGTESGGENWQDPIYKDVIKRRNVVNGELVKERARSGPKQW